MFEILASYIVGSVVGFLLFRTYIKEDIVTRTIDMLVDQDYVRAYDDEHGVTQLYKWYENEDVVEAMESIRVIVKNNEEDINDEKDDAA